MANQRMKDSWARMKNEIRSVWGEDLDDSTLEKGRRDLNKMVEVIHDNTGNPRAQIRSRMSALL